MRVVATGVELRLADEPIEYEPLTPEERGERERVARGELVEVRASLFVEIEEDDGGRSVIQGWSPATARIDLTSDPTSALVQLARDARDEDDLLGDVLRDEDLTRFEYHAAPHRIELAPDLRERLEAANWRDRPPRWKDAP